MSVSGYPLFKQTEDFYWFISSGPNGNIYKGIFLSRADIPTISNSYNLGLADYISGKWTDENRTGNGDVEKVMGTIVTFIASYLTKFPNRRIYVRGNTEAKRRLYQRLASNSLAEITENYDLYGKEYDSDEFELFAKGKMYEALLVERK